MKYSEYEHVELDDISLEEKKEVSPIKVPGKAPSALVRSEIIEEPNEKIGKLIQNLKDIELPKFKNISEKELENDVFRILTRPPVFRYLITLFFSTALVGSVFF